MRARNGLCASAAILGAVTSAAAWDIDALDQPTARERRAEAADVAQPWSLQFEPAVWYVAPGGRVRLPGSPTGTDRVRLEDVNLDTPRLSPYGELHLRTGEWRFMVSGVATDLKSRGAVAQEPLWIGPTLVSPGERTVGSIDFASAEVNVAYRITIPDEIAGQGGPEFRGTLEALWGLRMYTLSFEFDTPSASARYSDLFFEPLVGLKYTMEIYERFNIDVQASIGAFDDGGHRRVISYDILAGFSYRPTENIGVQIGYRNLAYSMRSGSGIDQFKYGGALAGLYGGVLIRF